MLDQIEFDDLALAKRIQPNAPKLLDMNENIGTPVLWFNEAEAPVRIKPLDGAFWHGFP